MEDTSIRIYGELSKWPTKDSMATILRDSGLQVIEGRYSVRVQDCSHFVFQEYCNDICNPSIDADAESLADMMRDGKLVSDALARADIRHRFELYDASNAMVGYLHHHWPRVLES